MMRRAPSPPSLLTLTAFFLVGVGTAFLGSCSGDGTSPEEESLPEPPKALFLAIHHEPGPDPRSDGYATLHWPALVELVAAAEAQGHHLTLLMNPQWARFILDDPLRTSQVRGWGSRGHEIGLHSHGPSMGAWNGYSDQALFRTDPGYLGPLDSLMALMNRVPGSGTVKTAAVTDGDSELDYPPGIRYDVDGGASGLGDLVSVPSPVTWNGHTMSGLRHARYCANPGGVCLSTSQIGAALAGMGGDQVAGIVFHVFEYHDSPLPFQELFAFLKERGLAAKTVSEIQEGSG